MSNKPTTKLLILWLQQPQQLTTTLLTFWRVDGKPPTTTLLPITKLDGLALAAKTAYNENVKALANAKTTDNDDAFDAPA